MKEPTISTVSSIRFPCRISASLPDAKRLDISLPMARRRHGLPVGSGRAGHDLTWGCLRPSARLPPTAARVRIRSRTKSVSVPKTVHLDADRVAKERAMRRRQLKWLWARLGKLAAMNVKREEMLMKLGAARSKAPTAWRLVEVAL